MDVDIVLIGKFAISLSVYVDADAALTTCRNSNDPDRSYAELGYAVFSSPPERGHPFLGTLVKSVWRDDVGDVVIAPRVAQLSATAPAELPVRCV